jgi:hypothetical protein
MDEATDLQWDSEKETMRNLESVYRRASTLTHMSVSVLKERFRHFMEHKEILVSDKATRGSTLPANTAEWIWQAKSAHKDYHENMDGAGFEWWLENRLVPAFEHIYPGKKMIVVGPPTHTQTLPHSHPPRPPLPL